MQRGNFRLCNGQKTWNRGMWLILLFFGALLVYTFKVLAISSLIYLCLIPISYFHYKKIKKEKNITSDNDEGLEDIL